MNKVFLTGRLAQDAALLDLNKGGRKAIKFTLAVDKNYKNAKDGKTAYFIPAIYFTNHSSKLMDYLTKGKLISIEGKLSIRSVEGEGGTKKYFTNIIVDNIDFLGSNKSKAL